MAPQFQRESTSEGASWTGQVTSSTFGGVISIYLQLHDHLYWLTYRASIHPTS